MLPVETLRHGAAKKNGKKFKKLDKTKTSRDSISCSTSIVVALCGPAQATVSVTAHFFCTQILPVALWWGWLFMCSL